MTNELRNVPDLRFPGFEGEWEESNIDNEFDFFNNNRKPIKENLRNKGEYPYYGATGIIDYVDDFIFDGNFILIGEDGANIVSRSAPLVYFATGKFWVNNHAHILYPKFGDIYFNYLLLENIDYEKYNTGTAQPKLNVQNLKKIKIKSPRDNSEQQKIGKFFSKLDRQIELEEQKLAKLEEQKKGYMQKIFSQEFRFKDENGNDYPEWEDKLISDIGKVITGNTPSKKENDYWNSNQYIWVTPTDISNKKNIYTSGYQLSQKGFSKARQLPKNTLLITCIASIGKNAILRIEGSCNQQINAVIPNDNYDVDYLYYAFEDVSKLMKSIAGKTATQIVNKAVFEKLLLNVPIYEEQQKISGFLNKVDILIDKQAQKIDELKLRKQGFLQKMFV